MTQHQRKRWGTLMKNKLVLCCVSRAVPKETMVLLWVGVDEREIKEQG